MGKFSLARNLSSDSFKKYIAHIKEHRWTWVRLSAMYALTPLIDGLVDESIEDNRPPHPISKFLKRPDQLPTDFDVIIIGTGAGGAPAAYELSKQGLKVAIIEKGDILKLHRAPTMLEKYYVGQGMTISMNGGTLLVLAGSTVGGTTSINSGTCLKPLQECLSHWDGTAGTDFANGSLDPYFDRVLKHLSVCVPPESSQSVSAKLFKAGLESLGRNDAYFLPHNTANCTGMGRCCFGCPTGVKQSTDMAYLPKAMEYGAQAFIKTEAIDIKENADNVVIAIRSSGKSWNITGKSLIIAGGALFTPGILKRSKIGNNTKFMGSHLKIHPASKVFAYFPDKFHGENGLPQGLGYKPPELPRVTLEGIHTPHSIMGQILSVGGDKFNWWMERADYLSSFGLMVQDRGTGSVGEYKGFPLITYKLHPEDALDMGRGLVLIGKVFLNAGAERVLLPLSGNMQKEFSSIEELEAFDEANFGVESFMSSGFHPQGTAGIGRVVDTNLKVIGSKRVYVCDASVLPDSPGVNPQVAIMGLSLRLATHLKQVV